jgi:hypothetical protein
MSKVQPKVTKPSEVVAGSDLTPAVVAGTSKSAKRTAGSGGKRKASQATKPDAGSRKQDLVLGLLKRKEGARIEEIVAKTKWQPHSVRGFFSGVVKKRLKLPLTSQVGKDGARRYRITARPTKA